MDVPASGFGEGFSLPIHVYIALDVDTVRARLKAALPTPDDYRERDATHTTGIIGSLTGDGFWAARLSNWTNSQGRPDMRAVLEPHGESGTHVAVSFAPSTGRRKFVLIVPVLTVPLLVAAAFGHARFYAVIGAIALILLLISLSDFRRYPMDMLGWLRETFKDVRVDVRDSIGRRTDSQVP